MKSLAITGACSFESQYRLLLLSGKGDKGDILCLRSTIWITLSDRFLWMNIVKVMRYISLAKTVSASVLHRR